MKGHKSDIDLSVFITRDIEQISGTLKQVKTLLNRIDSYWASNNNEGTKHPKISQDQRSYVDSFNWKALRHFQPGHDYDVSPEHDVCGSVEDYIDPTQEAETWVALNSALTVNPPN